ncbi:MAG: hypothetical protein H7Y09_06010 [Chitinophagaceae bacterium]|nr:hypothetical protein [Anaerolineae bacterium]
MKKTFHLGKIGGLEILVKPLVFVVFIVLWLVGVGVGIGLLKLSFGTAFVGGFLCVAAHYITNYLHHFGHSLAAKRAGYPMTGILVMNILAKSLYPRDEPELPAKVHIQRALGGPIFSGLVALILGLAAAALRSSGGILYGVVLFAFLDTLLVYTLGAFLPLGFTDGSTLLYWLPRR